MAKHYTVVEHQLGVHETIHAVLRYYNDNQMTDDELYLARVYFFNENTKQVRNAGEIVRVPILPQYAEK
jgi:hypothetical protein